jgi:hypothetical protein
MKKIPMRETPPQPSEHPQPRLRHAYDYEGEYEFPLCSIGLRQRRTPTTKQSRP